MHFYGERTGFQESLIEAMFPRVHFGKWHFQPSVSCPPTLQEEETKQNIAECCQICPGTLFADLEGSDFFFHFCSRVQETPEIYICGLAFFGLVPSLSK